MIIYFSGDYTKRLYIDGYKCTLIDNLSGEVMREYTSTEPNIITYLKKEYNCNWIKSKSIIDNLSCKY